ncbi:MAG: lysine--tRNA ligase [Phycisphaerae bacterium]
MLEKVQADRLAKLEKVRELGIDPYGRRYDTNEPIGEILARHQEDSEGKSLPDQTADAAGRLVLIRDMGKMMFAHLRDQTGQMQVAFRKNAFDETEWQLAKLLDLGDLVACSGKLQKSRTGEITVWADRLTLLSKSLNPMPEKFHGLQDVEARYRQRYLDLMTNPQSMGNFRRRVEIIEHIRQKLRDRGFWEVETPVLQPIYGGAAARPFTTHHNALDATLYMRISPELYLKRLLVGGMERVFEFSRNFRNEGIDTSHNPEFTLLELYQAYADYEVMMEITEELVSSAAALYTGDVSAQADRLEAEADRLDDAAARIEDAEDGSPTQAASRRDQAQHNRQKAAVCREAQEKIDAGRIALPYGKTVLDFTPPWRRATYGELLREHAGVEMTDIAAVREKARQLGTEESNKDDAVVINEVFEETVEPHLVQPTFVKDYPAALCPLTRRHPNDPNIALRFEAFAANMELGNAYTELNDPAVQEANFAQQVRGEAENETMRVMDEDFVAALRHGMPPAGGLGIGIDRIIMLLTNTTSIRDVILFPTLRPQGPPSHGSDRPVPESKPRDYRFLGLEDM